MCIISSDWPEKLYTLSYIIYPFAGALISTIVALPISILTGGEPYLFYAMIHGIKLKLFLYFRVLHSPENKKDAVAPFPTRMLWRG